MTPIEESSQATNAITTAVDLFVKESNYFSPSAAKVAAIFENHKKHISELEDCETLCKRLSDMKVTIERREGVSDSYMGKLYRNCYRFFSSLFNWIIGGSFRFSHAIAEDLLREAIIKKAINKIPYPVDNLNVWKHPFERENENIYQGSYTVFLENLNGDRQNRKIDIQQSLFKSFNENTNTKHEFERYALQVGSKDFPQARDENEKKQRADQVINAFRKEFGIDEKHMPRILSLFDGGIFGAVTEDLMCVCLNSMHTKQNIHKLVVKKVDDDRIFFSFPVDFYVFNIEPELSLGKLSRAVEFSLPLEKLQSSKEEITKEDFFAQHKYSPFTEGDFSEEWANISGRSA